MVMWLTAIRCCSPSSDLASFVDSALFDEPRVEAFGGLAPSRGIPPAPQQRRLEARGAYWLP